MRVGINLINFGPGASPESLARAAELGEALGYHLLMISDHVAITPDVQARYPAPLYDPFTTLGWLAGLTRRVELGTTVIILPYRHPIETARMAANVDQLSGGRFILGIGVGWARQEFDALGVPFHQRGAMTDDYLAAIKTVWADEVASYDGRFASFRNVRTAPHPLQRPHPPIWVGGASDAALRRAVLHGDAWHPIRIRVDWLRDTGLPRLREIAKTAGKPLPALCPRIRLRLTDAAFPEGERVAGEGNLDQVRADLEALQALGARYVLLDTYVDDPEATRDPEVAWRMLRTLAERVLDLPREGLR
jgi:probable F420-dependent oxidoreductase